MNCTIREAGVEDLETVVAIYQAAGIDTREESLTRDDARRIFGKMKSYPDYRVYLAEVGGAAVGTFALLIMDNLGHHGAPSGVVEDVAVARASQGMGIGKAMMKFALQECARAGCYKMALSSNENRSDARKFYESLGFARHGFSFSVDLQ